ncbi:hypothetical protein CMI37_37560 [Candidatus Pacearchaeota archaeon]|nr:hypothetical protein [Candidatus Pacearchaeota archaeon]|tara:strand:+ start:76 stop:354 length:279 start_codon:yes stop_codon:yes gene_type:complete
MKAIAIILLLILSGCAHTPESCCVPTLTTKGDVTLYWNSEGQMVKWCEKIYWKQDFTRGEKEGRYITPEYSCHDVDPSTGKLIEKEEISSHD